MAWGPAAWEASATARASNKSSDHEKAQQLHEKAAKEAMTERRFGDMARHDQAAAGHKAEISHAIARETGSASAKSDPSRKAVSAEIRSRSINPSGAGFGHNPTSYKSAGENASAAGDHLMAAISFNNAATLYAAAGKMGPAQKMFRLYKESKEKAISARSKK